MTTAPWYRVVGTIRNIYGEVVEFRTEEHPDQVAVSRSLEFYLDYAHAISAKVEEVSRNPTLLCKRCEGTGLVRDESACGDPEHCAPTFLCHCDQAERIAYS